MKLFMGLRRAFLIIARALAGVHSPSLGRRVRISDIWKSRGHERRYRP